MCCHSKMGHTSIILNFQMITTGMHLVFHLRISYFPDLQFRKNFFFIEFLNLGNKIQMDFLFYFKN